MTLDEKKALGARIQELRALAGLTQSALAERAGVKVATLRAYEIGVRSPTFTSGMALARALGVRPDALLEPAAAAPQDGPGRPRKKL